jgi:hypothetical protein
MGSFRRRPGLWLMALLVLLSACCIGVLCAIYVPRPRYLPPAPAFSAAPRLVSSTATSLDVQLQVNTTALVQYLLLPAASVRGLVAAQTVADAALGQALQELQVGWGWGWGGGLCTCKGAQGTARSLRCLAGWAAGHPSSWHQVLAHRCKRRLQRRHVGCCQSTTPRCCTCSPSAAAARLSASSPAQPAAPAAAAAHGSRPARSTRCSWWPVTRAAPARCSSST